MNPMNRLFAWVSVLSLFPLLGCTVSAEESASAESKKWLQERDAAVGKRFSFQAEGELAKSLAAAEKVIDLERKIFGEKLDPSQRNLDHWIDLLIDLEQWDSIPPLLEKVREPRIKEWGKQHVFVHDLARLEADVKTVREWSVEKRKELKDTHRQWARLQLLLEKGKFDDAEDLAKELLETIQNLWGKEHAQTGLALFNSGVVLSSQGRTAEAQKQFALAKPIANRTLGEDHPVSIRCEYFLGDTNRVDFTAAEIALQNAAKRWAKHFGKENVFYLNCQARLGPVYEKLNNRPEAEKALQESLRISIALEGAGSLRVALANRQLGEMLRKSGKPKEAKATLLAAAEGFEKNGGKEQPGYVWSLQELGRAARLEKDFKTSEGYFREVVKLSSSVFRQQKQFHAEALEELGSFLVTEKKNGKEAIPFLQEAANLHFALNGVKSLHRFICLQMLGKEYSELEEHLKAGEAWKEALEAVEAILPKSKYHVTVLQFLAINARNRQSYDEAKKALEQGISLAEALDEDPMQIAELHEEAGLLYRLWAISADQPPHLLAARKHLGRAAEIFGKLGKPLEPKHAWALAQLGEVCVGLRDFKAAEDALKSALAFFEPAKKQFPLQYVTTVVSQAGLEMARGQFRQAIPLWKTAVESVTAKNFVDHLREELFLKSWIGAHQSLQEWREAEAISKRLQTLIRERYGEQDDRYGDALERIAFQRDAIGDLPGAKALILQSLGIRKKNQAAHPLPYAATLRELGKVTTRLREFDTAEKSLSEAREIYRRKKGENDVEFADVLEANAWLRDAQGDRKTARELAEQSLAIRRKVWGQDDVRTLSCINALAARYASWGEHKEAKKLYAEVAERRLKREGVDSQDLGQTLLVLGDVLVNLKEFAEAEKALQESLRIAEKLHGKSHPSVAMSQSFLGELYWNKREPNKTIEYYRLAIETWRTLGQDRRESAYQWELLGIVLNVQRDSSGAAKAFTESLAVRRRLLDDAFLRLDEMQQLQASTAYRGTLDNYLSLGKLIPVEEAYRQVLTWKGSVTLNQRAVQLLRQTPEVASLLSQKAEATSNLARESLSATDPEKRKERIAFWQDKASEAERKLLEKSPQYRSTKQTAEEMLQGIRKALPAKSALIDYLEYRSSDGFASTPGESHLVAFIVRPDRQIVRVELGATVPIGKAIEAFRRDLSATEPASGSESPGLQLRKAIWTKLEEHLEGVETIFLSPDGELARLPFAALPGKDPAKFLLEERRLALLPVPQLLAEWRKWQPPKGNPQMLLVGGVDFDQRGKSETVIGNRQGIRGNSKIRWDSLPKSQDEIDNIEKSFRKRFDGAGVSKLSGSQATKTEFRKRLGQQRYLHLATHGFFADPENRSIQQTLPRNDLFQALFADRLPGEVIGYHPGLLSGIVLAGANQPAEVNGEDGILTALEVRDFDLSNTELVVLSACETGLGQTAGGEGVLGLQRAFHLAGAKNVVCSYWRVSDEGTAAMMTLFYRKLWLENKSPLDALRESQLFLMRNPGQIPELAKLRGSSFLEKDLPEASEPKEPSKTRSPIKVWASFVLSGGGQ